MKAIRRIELEKYALQIWQDGSQEDQIMAVISLTKEEFKQLFVETKD
ncbi:MAG: hypothetical protein PHW31_01970 [Candidatus Pacebacteria bacterium]|nr:hypothetical protein [Candidatus Paceibacterota bacterium]